MEHELLPAEAPIFGSYAEAVKSGCAAACNLSRIGNATCISPFRERIAADIGLLFRGLLVGYIVISGLFLGRWIAELLRAAWIPAILSIGGFYGVIWYIVRDLRRAFRRAEARRRRIAEGLGLDAAENWTLAGARPADFRGFCGRDCL